MILPPSKLTTTLIKLGPDSSLIFPIRLGDDSIEGGLGSGSDEFYGGYGNDILNSATEQLNIDVSLALDAVPTITYEIAAGGSGTNLLVDGNVVAFLVGVDLSTLNASNVNVTNTNVTP
jgi:hypothetical protein